MKNSAELTRCSEERKEQLKELCAGLGITMHHYELLNLALTHTSFAHETPHYPHNEHNERLEFLGDAVLGLIVSTYMFEHFPHFDEGRMTKLRAQVVCEASLYQCAKRIRLGDYLRMGNGELSSGGNKRPSILADAFEAVLAAVYLDGGLEEAGKLVREHVVNDIERKLIYNDAKTVLQELLVRKNLKAEYVLVSESGPDHDKTFVSLCRVGGQDCGQGTGHTKKASEQEAARETIRILKEENTCI